MLQCFISMGQSPNLTAVYGNTAIIGCQGLAITSPIPNPSLVEWWYNDGINPPTIENIGGITYSPMNAGNYYVTHPSYSLNSNAIASENFIPISISQLPSGNLTNAIVSSTCASVINLNTSSTSYPYSNQIWYQDNRLVSTNSNLNTWRPGVFALQADGPCGPESANLTINYVCNITNLINCGYGLTYITGGICSTGISSDQIIGDTLTIMGTVVIGGHMHMLSNSIIYVGPGSTLTVDSTVFTSCDTWKGIVVDGGNLIFSSGSSTSSEFVKICDAEVALTLKNTTQPIIIKNTTFEDNGTHIALNQGSYDIEKCKFSHLKQIPNNNLYALFLNSKTTSNPMIYTDFATIANIDIATFDHRDDNTGSPNWVTAIEMNNSSLGNTAEITINDNFLNGVVANNSNGLLFLDVRFGTLYVKQITPYVANPPFSQNAFIFKNCTNIDLGYTTIDQAEFGVQFYNNENANPQTLGSTFHHLTIQNTSAAGIVLAPDVNPITNTNPALNTDITPMKIDILCSRISGCPYGIVGSGRKTDFEGYTVSGSSKIYNQTDPSIDFSGLNSLANILWSERPAWKTSPTNNRMTYYSDGSWPYKDQIAPNISGTIDLDGEVTDNNNISLSTLDDAPFNGIARSSGSYCSPTWLSFKKTPTSSIEILAESNVKIFPNPVETTLFIEMPKVLKDGRYSIEVINQLGQKVIQQSFYNTNTSIDVRAFKQGVYYMTIAVGNGRILHKAKFIKQ